MREFSISEISAVDRPAQKGARAVIMKRDDSQTDEEFAKGSALTTSMDGHSHRFALLGPPDGVELNSGDTSYENGHSHPWIRLEDGTIVVGETNSHRHDVAEIGKQDFSNKEDDIMSKEDDKNTPDEQVANLTKRNDELEASLVETNARADMNDVQKSYFDGLDPQLDDDKRIEFIKADTNRRQIIIDAVTAKDKVIYKSDDGSEYRESDDPRLVKQARRNDDLAKKLVESNDKVEKADLRKRAETDLAHMPGTVETRMEMLKAVDGIEDDEAREAALESLKAQDAGLAKAFETNGHLANGAPEFEKGSPSAQLETLVQEYAEKHDVDEAAAYDVVLKTKEGGELYAKSVN